MFRKISSRVLEQRPAEEDRRKAAIDAALAKAPPPRASKENWTIGTNTAGLHAQGTGAEPAQIPPALSVPSASAWPSSGLPATVRHSDARTGLAAALGPGKASPVWSGSSLDGCAAGSMVGSQPALGLPRARRVSQQRSAGGGPNGANPGRLIHNSRSSSSAGLDGVDRYDKDQSVAWIARRHE